MVDQKIIPEHNEKFSFTSTFLLIFTVFVATIVLYSLAASASVLAEGFAFIVGLAIFMAFFYIGARQLRA